MERANFAAGVAIFSFAMMMSFDGMAKAEGTSSVPAVSSSVAVGVARQAIGPSVGAGAGYVLGDTLGGYVGNLATGSAMGLGVGIIFTPTQMGSGDYIPSNSEDYLSGGGMRYEAPDPTRKEFKK